MWVRSQDRRDLMNANGFFVEWEINQHDEVESYNVFGFTNDISGRNFGYGRVLGRYQSEERALEVLDQLHCNINYNITGVYVMPEA
jgi:hypothetical protein